MAASGFGTLMQIGDGGGPENFTTIAEVKDITAPQLSRDTFDVTHHSSPGQWEELIAGIKRSGQVTFDANWLPTHATQGFTTGLGADYNNGTKRNFKIIFPGGHTWAFAGFVIGYNPTAPVNGVLGLSVTIKPTGAMTIT